MNYYQALQRKTDGRWDYTRTRDGETRPVGYCRGWDESTEEELVARLGEQMGAAAHAVQQEARRAFRDRYHEDGHETKEEACECYKRYLLDNHVGLNFCLSEDTQHRCQYEGCENWTRMAAKVGMLTYVLCDEHRNLRSLEGLVFVGHSVSSY